MSVRFWCKDEVSAAGFDKLVADIIPQIIEHEPGTLIYAVHAVEGKPLQRIFYELYRDRAAFDVHEGQPHIRRFLDAREAFLASVNVDFLSCNRARAPRGRRDGSRPGRDQGPFRTWRTALAR